MQYYRCRKRCNVVTGSNQIIPVSHLRFVKYSFFAFSVSQSIYGRPTSAGKLTCLLWIHWHGVSILIRCFCVCMPPIMLLSALKICLLSTDKSVKNPSFYNQRFDYFFISGWLVQRRIQIQTLCCLITPYCQEKENQLLLYLFIKCHSFIF